MIDNDSYNVINCNYLLMVDYFHDIFALSWYGNPESVKVLVKHDPSGENYILNTESGEKG